MQKIIEFEDKEALYENPSIPDKNKVKSDDMNEIKSVVNGALQGTNAMGSIVVDDVSCKNMLDVDKKIVGGYDESGNWVNSSNYMTVQYIPAKANTQYIISSLSLDLTKYTALRVVFWNSSMGFISRSNAINPSNNTFTFTTPNNTAFIALCFYTAQTASLSDLTQGQLEIGSEATSYTPYKNFDGEIYSLGEVKVGTWIDGKPIYRKVIDMGLIPNNTTTTIDISNLNIEYLVDLRGMLKVQNSVGFRPLPFPAGGANDIRVDVNNGSLRIQTFASWTGFTPNYIILEYTKTSSSSRSIETSGEEDR